MEKEVTKNSSINWDDLTFSLIPTRSMYRATCIKGEDWNEGGLVPFGNIELSPAAAVLNYGQGIFEGSKAYRTEKNRIVIFRPAMNGERMQKSAERLCIPPVSNEMFLNAIENTVLDNIDFVPPINKGSLYIRPIIWGTGPVLGIQEAPSYTFLVYVSPVGPYFKGEIPCLHIKVTKSFHRTATKGTGSIKAIGNYASSLYPLKNSKEQGFNELMYLNSQNEDLIDELGSANVFALKDGKLITPKLSGSILPGVTRDSTIKIARDILGLDVIEKDVYLEDFLLADEVFCTGTAVVICPIGRITTDDNSVEISNKIGPITSQLRRTLLDIQLERIEDKFGWLNAINNL